jgi:carbohydrate-selective porin OprB
MVEGQYGWGEPAAEGSVRLLAYVNRGNLGSYSDALSIAASGPPGALPDVDATATPGAVKYGFAALVQQEVGLLDLFLRLGWNDGRTQTFCFTSIDRSISVGAQLDGVVWGRRGDFAGAGVAVSGLSSSHAAYLAAGGTEFQLGDGALAYGWEVASEVYYSLQPVKYLQVTADLQAIFNPGMNAARGPTFLGGVRVHAHF